MMKFRLRIVACFTLALLACQLLAPAVSLLPGGARTAYAAATPTHLYAMNEGSGTTVTDSAGSSNGTLNGGASWTAGKSGQGVSLDGTDDYISFPALVQGYTDFTISTWVKLDALHTWDRIFDFGSGTNAYMLLTPKSGSNTLRFTITNSGGGGEQFVESAKSIPTGAWMHLAVVLSGSTAILYVNGEEVARNTISLTPARLGTLTNNYIGKAQYTGNPYMQGTVDDFRVYNSALSASDLSSLVHTPSAYYVDCSAAMNGSGTIASPWNALTSVNNKSGGFGPGDAIYLKKGTACSGQLKPTGTGTSVSPIVIDSYGTGAPPIINGGGSTEAAVYLLNESYWTVQNLEVTNDASQDEMRSGILAEVTDSNTYYGITIRNNNVHNVRGVSIGNNEKYGRYSSGGITVRVPSKYHVNQPGTGHFENVLIDSNNVHDVGSIGITTTSGDGIVPHTYIKNLVVQNNNIQSAQADAIYIGAADSPLIQYNTSYDIGFQAINSGAIAHMWSSATLNPTYQFNEAARIFKTNDSQAWDCDWGITSGACTYQYNYSHDNSGGFYLNCANCTSWNYKSTATQVIRYNINQGSSRINNAGDNARMLVYNNVFYSPNQVFNTNPYSWSNLTNVQFSSNALVSNNIFVGAAGSVLAEKAGLVYDSNLYYGFTSPTDAHAVTGDPKFVNPGSGGDGRNTVDGYQLLTGSPAIGAGAVIADNGGLDYWGNTVSATAAPNIGAYNGSGIANANLASNPGFETGSLGVWSSGGSVVNDGNAHTGSYAVKLTGSSVGANQTVSGLKPNTTYTLSGWAKVSSAGDIASIGVKNFGGSETYQTTNATGYSKVSVTFTTGSSNTSANIYIWKVSGTSTTYADDFVLIPGGATSNYVMNAGLELGIFGNWTGASASVVNDSANAHSGSYAAKLVGSSASISQTVTGLKPNTLYRFRAWVKTVTPGDSVTIGASSFGGTNASSTVSGMGYTQGTVTFTTGPNNTSATITLSKLSGTGDTYIDDIFVRPGNIPLAGVGQPGFEAGNLGWWSPYGTPSAVNDGNAHSGSYAVKLPTSTGIDQWVYDLKPNTTYTLTAWGKAGSGGSLLFGVKNYGGTELTYTFTSTSYTKASITFTTGATNTTADIYFYGLSGTNPSYGDDFVITEQDI
ncbi:LamG-like jellyroll fold domain-containing protein [Cohnella sp.]|uniref:LamG-like jellyroll fold domain-containing protein n=1 Tax=Cohnella sp. TaxID=1883426 RepID=UPI0035626DB7